MSIAVIIETLEDLDLINSLENQVIYEFRLDKEPRLIEVIPQMIEKDLKVILTLRSEAEGGEFIGNPSEMLDKITKYPVDFIDFEIDRDKFTKLIESNKTTLIRSKHDYSEPMIIATENFIHQLSEIDYKSDEVIKFVGKPVDSFDMIKSLKLAKSKLKKSVVLGIGSNGILSRTMIKHFNQQFVFGSMKESANFPVYKELIDANSEDAILTGLIGQNLTHSLSPQIHKLLMMHSNLKGYYHLFEVNKSQNVIDFVQELSETPISGINVTFPYKDLITNIGHKDKWVEKSGVANTIKFETTGISLFNTDISGFQKFFQELSGEDLHSVLIFGAGGAAKAVCFALLDLGVKDITVVNRTKSRFDTFPDELKHQLKFELLENSMDLQSDIYLNATTIGYNNDNPTKFLPFSTKTKLVIDLNYKVNGTLLTQEAVSKGIEAYDGKKMLFYQAADAFEIWTGNSVNRDLVFSQFKEELTNEN